MTFLTGYLEVMLSTATDPKEIELRRKVLDDHLAMQRKLGERITEAPKPKTTKRRKKTMPDDGQVSHPAPTPTPTPTPTPSPKLPTGPAS